MIVLFDRNSSHVFKVVLIGDPRVGKTSLITRKTNREQIGSQQPTVGLHGTELPLCVDHQNVIMQVWDTAGQEMYRALVPVYLREARAAILVFDMTEEESFHGLNEWFTLLNDTLPESIPVYLTGNTIDLVDQIVINNEMAETFAVEHKAKFRKVSALTGDGVEELFEEIGENYVRMGLPMEKRKLDSIQAHAKPCAC
jgi:small GTP-binding protein